MLFAPQYPIARLPSPSDTCPASTRWWSVAAALLLAACAHSPQAAVPPDGAGTAVVVGASASALACQEAPRVRPSLQRIAHELQAQGMVLQASCKAASGGWMVQVRVVDGVKARKVVRGPLADGGDVDMGTPSGVVLAGAPTGADGFSPDVQHNRQWLRALMARHQFDNLPDAWWHFAQPGVSPAQAADTDLAVR
ncbi:D-alanyl-D-alanine dipeptidase [Acidovorax sp. 69]|uniref:M15 family metallopeptidase n=1 Tax=Acidovorax sp. 69 TaxID=2035202 RepID=UPI000C23CC3E|nr:M15 family metallopeptidase [Acidovorax sp. 69]PJI96255.1 D-alanyl-D-alanine dipeptidase [Acidovorax sp. 69]